VVAVTVTVETELSVAVTVVTGRLIVVVTVSVPVVPGILTVLVRVSVSVVPGKLTVVVTVLVSVGPGAVVVTVTVTVDPGAAVGVVTGLLVVVYVVGVISGGGVVGVLGGVVVEIVDVLVHTGQVVMVDVEVTVIVAGALAIIAGDSGGFALFLKVCVVIVEVLVSASKIGDDPGIVQYAEELVGNDTVGASDGDSAGDAEGSGTAEYATALGRLVAAYCILEAISNNRRSTDLPRFTNSDSLKNCLRYCHIFC
jgi:hypothetical protein